MIALGCFSVGAVLYLWFGLTGMEERVAQMGGELAVTSARGKGTKIVVISPY